jgi:hypothetical protein
LLSFFARLGVSQLIVPGQYLGQLSLDIVAHLAISVAFDRLAQPLHGGRALLREFLSDERVIWHRRIKARSGRAGN